MTETEVLVILKACLIEYPNQFLITTEVENWWNEKLKDVPFELVWKNFMKYTDNPANKFPPRPAELKHNEIGGHYDDHKQRTERHILYLEDVRSKAVKMPQHLRELVEGNE